MREGRCGVEATGDAEGSSRLLAGRAVLVTGATGTRVASGICDAVHAAGGRVVVSDLTDAAVAETVERYPGSLGVTADVTDPADAERVVATAVGEYGALDGLVNNAGIGLRETFYEATEEDFDQVLDTDLRGVWLMSRAFARSAIARGRPGSIVNVSSVHAGSTIDRYGVYAGAKAGVEGLTRGCAVEVGPHGIRCNAIAPGFVPPATHLDAGSRLADRIDAHTQDEQPLYRTVEPIDCGWAAVFLLSELSRCITGQVIGVDAGLSIRLYNREWTERANADRQARTGTAGA